MGNQISWHVVLAIKQDQLDDFQALTREMVEFTRTESGARNRNRSRRSRAIGVVREVETGSSSSEDLTCARSASRSTFYRGSSGS